MASPSKHVFQVVFLSFLKVFSLRDTMIIATVDTLSARTSRKVDAKVGGVPLLKVISLGEACVYLWMQLGQRRRSVDVHSAIRQILVVPNVVVVVALFVGCLLLSFFSLSPGGSLHPLVNLQVLKLVELLNLVLFGAFILSISLARVDQLIASCNYLGLRLDLIQVCQSVWVKHRKCLALHLIDRAQVSFVLLELFVIFVLLCSVIRLIFLWLLLFFSLLLPCHIDHLFGFIDAFRQLPDRLT